MQIILTDIPHDYSRTTSTLIRIKWDDETSGYAENRIIRLKKRLHWQSEVGGKILQTAVFGHVFIYIQIKHLYIIPYVYLTNEGGGG